jgi:hypothetical protein
MANPSRHERVQSARRVDRPTCDALEPVTYAATAVPPADAPELGRSSHCAKNSCIER